LAFNIGGQNNSFHSCGGSNGAYGHGCIHDWGTKKGRHVFKGLQRTTLDLFLSYIIIGVVDCCMPIDKMIIVKLILKIKFFGYHVNVILSPVN